MMKLFLTAACFAFLLSCNNNKTEDKTAAAGSDSTKDGKTPPQSEFADQKYTDIGIKAMHQFEGGDMDAWMTNYADNAVYVWSSGDSLAGKAAIAEYWKNRRLKVIDSLSMTNDIWLPIKVNQPQKGPDMAGIWLLGWYQVNVKYKNGQKLNFWVHTDYHFNNEDKIDRLVMYIDRAPINAAVSKK